MDNNIFYLYIYLDPRKPGKYIFDDLCFNYEPIYVGKGKYLRFEYHLKNCQKHSDIKNNKLKLILKQFEYDYVLKNFIIFSYVNENENFILNKEKEYIEKIGTIVDIVGVNKRGPLTNLLRGGIANPIFFGEKNPMYNKTIFQAWEEKGLNVKEKIESWKQNLSIGHKGWADRLTIEKYNSFVEKCKIGNSGENNYFYKLTEEEKQKNIEKKVKSWKKTVSRQTKEKKEEINKKQSESLKNYYKNIDEEEFLIWKKNVSLGLKAYYKDIENNEIEQQKLSIRGKKAKETLKADVEKYEKLKLSLSGENNYLYKYGGMKQYILKVYGEETLKEYIEKIKENTSGKNNPMYKNGYKISGAKNGRSINVIIHFPTGEKYLCIGTFKKFCKEILSKYKPQPHRKYKFNEEKDGWFFKKIEDITTINKNNYILYE